MSDEEKLKELQLQLETAESLLSSLTEGGGVFQTYCLSESFRFFAEWRTNILVQKAELEKRIAKSKRSPRASKPTTPN